MRSLFRTKKIHDLLVDSHAGDDGQHPTGLKRVLTARDLTLFGIAAIIGAGSFSSLGGAVFSGGPGVVILFILCGIACAFTAFCYAEFASRIPVAGSAYTYAYASFGELFAWVIGWALLMEYSIGNIYVAFSWSDYFTSLMEKLNIHVPDYISCSYREAHKAFAAFSEMTTADQAKFMGSKSSAELIHAWNQAPVVGGLRLIFDLPAIVINMLITYLVYRGIKESRNFSNAMVILKLAVVIMVIAVGAVYINPDNWVPMAADGTKSFMPNGFSGVMAAVSGVFFAYIGFDSLIVLAEESRYPQKYLPKGSIWSLVICTFVYILLALVLTGTVMYSKFANVGDPLAFIFEKENLNVGWMQLLVAVCAVIAMTSVLLVFQMGQPRIWMSMSRDGLLPPVFEKIHPKYKTPSFSTIVTGLVVGIPILFTDKTFVLDFTSIATLFAFVLVCGGVLLLPRKQKTPGRFNMPFINSKLIFPLIVLGAIVAISILFPEYFPGLFHFDFSANEEYTKGAASFLDVATPQISLIIFWGLCIILSVLAFIKQFSLIPLMGLTTCLYLLTGMTKTNWAWFLSWLALGLIIYFLYGYRKSKLAPHNIKTGS